MPSNIQKFGFVASPKDADEIIDYAEMYEGSEKAAFMMGVMLTWNLMVNRIDEVYHEDE